MSARRFDHDFVETGVFDRDGGFLALEAEGGSLVLQGLQRCTPSSHSIAAHTSDFFAYGWPTRGTARRATLSRQSGVEGRPNGSPVSSPNTLTRNLLPLDRVVANPITLLTNFAFSSLPLRFNWRLISMFVRND